MKNKGESKRLLKMSNKGVFENHSGISQVFQWKIGGPSSLLIQVCPIIFSEFVWYGFSYSWIGNVLRIIMVLTVWKSEAPFTSYGQFSEPKSVLWGCNQNELIWPWWMSEARIALVFSFFFMPLWFHYVWNIIEVRHGLSITQESGHLVKIDITQSSMKRGPTWVHKSDHNSVMGCLIFTK